MFEAFKLALPEGLDAFVIVAVLAASRYRIQRFQQVSALYAGIVVSLIASAGLGHVLLQGANTPLIESIFGALAALMAGALAACILKSRSLPGFSTVLLFTTLMIVREGMEIAVLLFSVQDAAIITGLVLGVVLAAGLSFAWKVLSCQVSSKRFIQISTTFLLLFVAQMLLYSFHELTEAGEIIPNTDYWHEATEPFSHDGFYGKWLSPISLIICGLWLVGSWIQERFLKQTVA